MDSEPFYVKESAGVVKVHQNSSEFFRVEAQYLGARIFLGVGNHCACFSACLLNQFHSGVNSQGLYLVKLKFGRES